MLVAIIQKLACYARIPFALVADELSDPAEKESTLLIMHYSRTFILTGTTVTLA